MNENTDNTIADSVFQSKAKESINQMLDCLLKHDGKICKSCKEVNICTFITEALLAFRNKYISASHYIQ
jgi:hypothetical protein